MSPQERRLSFDVRIGRGLAGRAAKYLEKMICEEAPMCEACQNLKRLVNELKHYSQDVTSDPMTYPNTTPVLPGI